MGLCWHDLDTTSIVELVGHEIIDRYVVREITKTRADWASLRKENVVRDAAPALKRSKKGKEKAQLSSFEVDIEKLREIYFQPRYNIEHHVSENILGLEIAWINTLPACLTGWVVYQLQPYYYCFLARTWTVPYYANASLQSRSEARRGQRTCQLAKGSKINWNIKPMGFAKVGQLFRLQPLWEEQYSMCARIWSCSGGYKSGLSWGCQPAIMCFTMYELPM